MGVLQTRTTQPKPATPTQTLLSTSGSPASRSKAAKNSWVRKLKGGKKDQAATLERSVRLGKLAEHN